MKKLLLIFVCLFVSFEVKSFSNYEHKDIKIKDCLKYLDKGKILHKLENIQTIGDTQIKEVVTIFSYNQKTYEHTLEFDLYETRGKKTNWSNLTSSYCSMIDFDKFKED